MLTHKPIIFFFEGNWTFSREIISNNLPYGKAEGEASFTTKEENFLNYHEIGKTYILENEKSIPFQKRFLYECHHDTLTVYFADGVDSSKVYQHYVLKEKEIKSIQEHSCGNDLYESYYTILSENEFSLKTIIRGPKKDFEITSDFLRDIKYI